MMFVEVAKIHIPNTFMGLAEMDFLDYGGDAAFFHAFGRLSRDFMPSFLRARRKKAEQTEAMGRWMVISNWLAVFGGR